MEDFADAVKRLYTARGWTRNHLIREASGYAIRGTSLDTIRNAVESGRGGKVPSVAAIEAIARTLDVDPRTFPVYRLQLARRLLDPDQVNDAAYAYADLLLSQMSPEDIAEEAAPPQTDTPDEDDEDAQPSP